MAEREIKEPSVAALKAGAKRIMNPAATPKVIAPKTDFNYRCVCCGKEFKAQTDNFPKSNSILFTGNDQYLPYCKTCVAKYYAQMLEFYSNNIEHAIEHCCWTFDYFFDKAALDDLLQTTAKNGTLILNYIAKIRKVNYANRGNTYFDTLKERFGGRIMSYSDLEVQVTKEDGTVETTEPRTPKETIEFFGFGYSDDEYSFLSKQYAEWSTRYECKTKAQEELFKNLCVAQLVIQRVQANGTNKEINDAMKTFQDLLGTANLKPSQTNDNALADQNTFGTLIRKWENESPISDPDPEWEDVDGIKEMIDTFFLGHLCNLVHVKNDQEEAYRREMKKYTVTPPVYDEDGEMGDTNILDKFSDKQQAEETE